VPRSHSLSPTIRRREEESVKGSKAFFIDIGKSIGIDLGCANTHKNPSRSSSMDGGKNPLIYFYRRTVRIGDGKRERN
jgi:putative aminopeptidase FrvX